MEPTNRQLFYVLPLPLSQPGLQARLAGINIMRLSEGRTASAPEGKESLYCRPASHSLLAPTYLWQQHINPHNLRRGLNASDFVAKVSTALTPTSSQDILISFALRHLSVYNAMALQNFYPADIFQRFNQVIDLKVALLTCNYFGKVKTPRSKNLNAAAKSLGFTGNLDKQSERLDALYYIYNYLNHHDPKIMAFLHAPRAARLEMALKRPYLITIDDNKGKINLLKVLTVSSDRRLIKALCVPLS